jgi:alcohol dehydrogenase
MDSAKQLQEILENEKPKKVFLVFHEAYEKSGAKQKFADVLRSYDMESFSDILPNPTLEQVERGVAAFRNSKADLVVAIGGGSVMDTAKSLNLLAAQEGDALSYIKKERVITERGKPLVAIPTTAGTGAEVTRFAVVYVDKVKYSLSHEFLVPTYVVLDSEFTHSMPPRITAETGMDALAQCIESFWSKKATEESKEYARKGIELILSHVVKAVHNSTPEAREAMAQGAHLSGKAINISETTACHALSYPFTAHFNVPHGHAVALTLPAMIEFNAETMEKDVAAELFSLLGANPSTSLGASIAAEAAENIRSLMKEIGLETKISKLGIESLEQIQDLVLKEINLERLGNNPRNLTPADIRLILQKIFA